MNGHRDYNRQVIDEFRANQGKVGGSLAGTPMLLLTTTGARSGQRRTVPMGYVTDGDRLIVFASNLGAPSDPAWCRNLAAQPDVTVETGSETFDGTATVTAGAERERLWALALTRFPFLVNHQARTARPIPVVALARRAWSG